MTTAAVTSWERRPLGQAALLWGGAALVAILAHGGALWYALHRPAPTDLAASPPVAVMIEFAPETVAPQSDLMEFAPDEADQREVVAPETLQVPDEPAMAEDRLTPATDLAPVTLPPDLTPVPMPPTVVPEVVLPPPERPAKEEPPPPAEAEKKAEKPTPPAPQKERRAAKSDAAAPAPKAAAPESGMNTAGKAATAAWRQRVSAHLERRKDYPAAARSRHEEGVAQVRFVIDDAGNVLSSRLVRSSGHAALDAEALALMKRASPIPAPPAGIPRTITVPIRFDVRD